MDSNNDLQDLYGSTSSDDQSSINSVIHVEGVLDTSETDSAESAPGTPMRRERQNNEALRQNAKNERGQDMHQETGEYEPPVPEGHHSDPETREHRDRLSDEGRMVRNTSGLSAEQEYYIEDDTSSDDDEDRRREEEAAEQDSDSSSTSEDTQIWVQHAKPRVHHSHHHTPSSQQRPKVPPKPYNGGLSSPSDPTRPPIAKRQSLVSQGSSGRVETRLLMAPDDTCGGDSGLSTESHETHSNLGDSHSHYQTHGHDPHSSRGYAQYLSDPHSTSTPHPRHSTSTTSSHPLAQYQAQKRASLGLYQHSSPSHQSHQSRDSQESPVMALHTVPSPSPSPIPPTLLMRNGEPSSGGVASPLDETRSVMRENMFNVLSFLYALFLVSLGATLPLAEIFAPKVSTGTFEGFYIYLYLMSIIFLLYVYLVLLRRSTSRCCPRRRTHHHDNDISREDTLLNHSSSWQRKTVSIGNNNHTGSFYLRLGAVGFGIGSMIHEGLMFGQLFERELIWECINIAMVIRPVAQLAFTFIQLYFIFLNSKMLIHRYKNLSRFGLMHMVATNLCVWLRVVISETMRELNNYNHSHATANHTGSKSPISTTTPSTSYSQREVNSVKKIDDVRFMEHNTHQQDVLTAENTTADVYTVAGDGHKECFLHDIMGHVVKSASPYLYPCTIQYSIIAAGILYVMWRNIGTPAPITPSSLSESEVEIRHKKNNRITVDCSGANRGLFFGIFTLVGIIISMIVFFVLVDKPGFQESAVIVTHSSEIVLYFLACLAVLIAAVRVRGMKFHPDRDNALEEILLLLSVVGVFVFGVLNVVAGRYCTSMVGGPLVITSSGLILFQATAQTVFIMNGLRRSAMISLHERKKPGREFVTFLLVCNIAMWGINTFEVLRSSSNPLAQSFYGFVAWCIVTHVTMPLTIFYRFHSVVCLATIWQSAYKLKLH